MEIAFSVQSWKWAHFRGFVAAVRGHRILTSTVRVLPASAHNALPSGPVTLVRVGGTGMDRLWLAEGRILRSGDAENLCRTQAEVELTRGHVRDLLSAPLGNHLVLVTGHHADQLQDWWEFVRS